MTLSQATTLIDSARKDWLLHEGSERHERYLAEVNHVLLEYGQSQFDAGLLAAARFAQRPKD